MSPTWRRVQLTESIWVGARRTVPAATGMDTSLAVRSTVTGAALLGTVSTGAAVPADASIRRITVDSDEGAQQGAVDRDPDTNTVSSGALETLAIVNVTGPSQTHAHWPADEFDELDKLDELDELDKLDELTELDELDVEEGAWPHLRTAVPTPSPFSDET